MATKHAVVGLTKSVALETAGSGVTSNAVCPGWVLTPLVEVQVQAKAEALNVSFEEAKVGAAAPLPGGRRRRNATACSAREWGTTPALSLACCSPRRVCALVVLLDGMHASSTCNRRPDDACGGAGGAVPDRCCC